MLTSGRSTYYSTLFNGLNDDYTQHCIIQFFELELKLFHVNLRKSLTRVRLSLELTTLSYFHRWQPCLIHVSEKVADTFLKFGNVPQLSWCLYSPLLFITVTGIYSYFRCSSAHRFSFITFSPSPALSGSRWCASPHNSYCYLWPSQLCCVCPQALEQPSNHTLTLDTDIGTA